MTMMVAYSISFYCNRTKSYILGGTNFPILKWWKEKISFISQTSLQLRVAIDIVQMSKILEVYQMHLPGSNNFPYHIFWLHQWVTCYVFSPFSLPVSRCHAWRFTLFPPRMWKPYTTGSRTKSKKEPKSLITASYSCSSLGPSPSRHLVACTTINFLLVAYNISNYQLLSNEHYPNW